MKNKKQPLIGICPIGKFVFSHEDAMRFKALIFEKFRQWDISAVNLDSVIPNGMIRSQENVAAAVRYFKEQQIDALFIPHCNFGTEGAAGMIAKQCGVPVLLWGPRDEAPQPDGTRLRDSLCGMFATSKVLHTLGVPFTYINNCHIDDPEFRIGVDRFVRAANVVAALATMKIGQVGQRIDFFWSTIVSESDLLQRFGIQVLPIDMVSTLGEVKKRTESNRKSYRAELSDLKNTVKFNNYDNEDHILHNFALRDVLTDKAQEHDLDGFCFQDFNSVPNELGAFLAFGCSLLSDAGYPVAPESDLHGAVSSILLEAAGGSCQPSFLPDLTMRHPDNDNAVLLWHGAAPLSLRADDSQVKVDLPWILKNLPTGLVHFKLKDGPLTVCRFDGDSSGGYRLGCGQGNTVDGPYTQEFYAWMEVNDWPQWERQIINGPYIHHCSGIFEHCADVLQEAARFIPNLEFEAFEQTK